MAEMYSKKYSRFWILLEASYVFKQMVNTINGNDYILQSNL